MGRNGYRPQMAKKGISSMNDKRSEERRRREQELIDKATELAIEMYGPALKELEKH